jgi:surfeit locus 1 family protein
MKRGVLLATALSVSAICVKLGFWQLDRHKGRRERNAAIEQRLALPPVVLQDSSMTDSLEYRRAVAVGLYDPDREVIEVGRAVNGVPANGVPAIYLVLPLRLDDGRAVLVEAGWIPSPDARSFRSPAVTADDTVEVHGVLLAPRTGVMPANVEWPISVRFADPTVLGPLYPYPLHAWILRRTDRLPDVKSSLHVIPLPELTQGPHLSYAVQWFVFAAIAVVGVTALLMVEIKDARRSTGDSDRAY